MQKEEKSLAETPAIGISFSHSLDDHRNLVFQSFVPADCSDAEFAAMLDKITRASDRQRAKCHIPNTESQLAIARNQLEAEIKKLQEAEGAESTALVTYQAQHRETGRRGEWTPSPAQKTEIARIHGERQKVATNIASLKNQIMQHETLLAEMRAKIAAAESANDG